MYDVWKTTNDDRINIDGNSSRKVNVAIYCRVSTEHEEQIKALDNQIEWFNDILPKHPNWQLVNSSCSAQIKRRKSTIPLKEIDGYYIDEGLSGLTAENRPALLQLIDDCKAGKVDLILTREVCRFSRNIVDAISIQRELKTREIGVAIYFYQDNIFTYDNDAEMKLGIFATLAQNESQKISERVKAGQKTSRAKGVLYGNGNILGYNLIINEGNNAYEINEEQAETVRRIFELCLDGYGVGKIGDILVQEKRKNSSGETKWSYQNILRILQKKVYCGYLSYNVTISDDCLEKKRHNINKSERIYKKVEPSIVPVIIDEDIFNSCQEKMKKRKKEYFSSKTGSGKDTSAKNVFSKKLRCKCGHSFRRDTWHKNKSGVTTYGFTCYNVLNHGKAENYTDEDEIKKLNICDMPAISELRLRIQALKVFNELIEDDSLIQDTIKTLKKKSVKNATTIENDIKSINSKIQKLIDRNNNYIDLVADGIISKKDFLAKKEENENEINKLQDRVEKLQAQKEDESTPTINEAVLREALNKILDCSDEVNDGILDKFVYRIIVDTPDHFIWQLHFKPITDKEPTFVDLCSHHIDLEFAKSYSKKHKTVIHKTRWTDIDIDVQIAI